MLNKLLVTNLVKGVKLKFKYFNKTSYLFLLFELLLFYCNDMSAVIDLFSGYGYGNMKVNSNPGMCITILTLQGSFMRHYSLTFLCIMVWTK